MMFHFGEAFWDALGGRFESGAAGAWRTWQTTGRDRIRCRRFRGVVRCTRG
jgi:hypothetical protein